MGKTQLAIAYVRQHQVSYTSVLWLNATSEQTLYASFRSLISGVVATEGLAEMDDERVLTHIHRWLSRPRNARWLLVFDNYDDPEQFSVDDFCPNTGHGSIIITTRLPDLVRGQQVRVQPLHAIDDGLAILQVRSGRVNTKQGESETLCFRGLSKTLIRKQIRVPIAWRSVWQVSPWHWSQQVRFCGRALSHSSSILMLTINAGRSTGVDSCGSQTIETVLCTLPGISLTANSELTISRPLKCCSYLPISIMKMCGMSYSELGCPTRHQLGCRGC